MIAIIEKHILDALEVYDKINQVHDRDIPITERRQKAMKAALESFATEVVAKSDTLPPCDGVGVKECATAGCGQPATKHFIRGDVGSHFCEACYRKVLALGAWTALAPTPPEVGELDPAYDRGRRDMLNALLALNPRVAQRLHMVGGGTEETFNNHEGRIPFNVVFWVTEVAEQLGIQPKDEIE